MVVVINERLWVREYEKHALGEPYGQVLNGKWELAFSDDLQWYWPTLYSDSKSKVESIRKAIKGECLPYY